MPSVALAQETSAPDAPPSSDPVPPGSAPTDDGPADVSPAPGAAPTSDEEESSEQAEDSKVEGQETAAQPAPGAGTPPLPPVTAAPSVTAAPPAAKPRPQVAPQASRLSKSRRPPSAQAVPQSSRRSPSSAGPKRKAPFRVAAQPPAPQGPNLDSGPTNDESDTRDETGKPVAKEGLGGLLAIVDLTSQVGSGTFLRGTEFGDNPLFDYALTLQPTWEFKDRTQVDLVLALSQELTDSDDTAKPRQLLLSDLRLGVRRNLHAFKRSKTAIGGELYAHFPTSLTSQGETLVVAAEPRVNVVQPVSDFSLLFRTAFRKNFHRYTSPVVDIDSDGLATCLARDGGNEQIDSLSCSAGGNNASHSWNNRLGVGYAPSEEWSFTALYTLAHAWTYESYDTGAPSDCDPLNPASCAGSGVGAASGAGRRDSQLGQLLAAYAPFSNLAFTLGVATGSATRTDDDRAIRFPFLDVNNQALNLTTYFLSVTLTEPIPFFKKPEDEHATLSNR